MSGVDRIVPDAVPHEPPAFRQRVDHRGRHLAVLDHRAVGAPQLLDERVRLDRVRLDDLQIRKRIEQDAPLQIDVGVVLIVDRDLHGSPFLYRRTRPEAWPPMSASASALAMKLKSPRTECFRQLVATANAIAWAGSAYSPVMSA